MAHGKHALRRRLPALIGGLFLLLFTVGVVSMVQSFIEKGDKPERPRVQQISLVKPPPPRDLPKPPEPEKLEEQPKLEEVKLEEAPPAPEQAQSDGPPPGDQLGLDAEGGAGGDAFGLAARKGGRDITTIGSAGGGGDRQAWYARQIARHFEEGLRRAKGLNGNTYNVQLNVWFDDTGRVRQVRLARGSGDGELDRLIQEEVHNLPPLREPLPDDLPQPVRVRVTSRT
jgi:protein TonB